MDDNTIVDTAPLAVEQPVEARVDAPVDEGLLKELQRIKTHSGRVEKELSKLKDIAEEYRIKYETTEALYNSAKEEAQTLSFYKKKIEEDQLAKIEELKKYVSSEYANDIADLDYDKQIKLLEHQKRFSTPQIKASVQSVSNNKSYKDVVKRVFNK